MNKPEAQGMLEFEKVKYLPRHSKSDTDFEIGYVSSVNDSFIFVKFKAQLDNIGWHGTTAQACEYEDITAIKGQFSGWLTDPKGRKLGGNSFAEAMRNQRPADELAEWMGNVSIRFDIMNHQREKGLK